jgi:hypothetical protein
VNWTCDRPDRRLAAHTCTSGGWSCWGAASAVQRGNARRSNTERGFIATAPVGNFFCVHSSLVRGRGRAKCAHFDDGNEPLHRTPGPSQVQKQSACTHFVFRTRRPPASHLRAISSKNVLPGAAGHCDRNRAQCWTWLGDGPVYFGRPFHAHSRGVRRDFANVTTFVPQVVNEFGQLLVARFQWPAVNHITVAQNVAWAQEVVSGFGRPNDLQIATRFSSRARTSS